MRRIRKGAEPAELREWRGNIRPRNLVPLWDHFPNPPSSQVRSALARDQAHICCYCCATIGRGNFHIEHFRPRETNKKLTYSWRNLLASCFTWRAGVLEGEIIETQQHCGDAKGNIFEDGLVDPTLSGADRLFLYSLNGKVHPTKSLRTRHDAVARTIDILNLNAPSLVARRAQLLAAAATDIDTMSREEWQHHYLQPTADGRLQEFWPALQYNYERHWQQMWL